jgi:2-polyprenyl-3-methyl-5-hydroxy-6-metoxy-1,4-benzoquinol methylase
MGRAEEILRWVAGPDVLDVGCTGHDIRPGSEDWIHGRLRARFPDMHGIDFEAENIKALQELGYKNLHVADAQSFSLEQRFDTIVAGELIEHLENPAGFLLSARQHLKMDGRIVLSTPYPFGLLSFLYALVKYPKTCSNAQHTLWLCPSTMHALVERAGLRVEHWSLLTWMPIPADSRSYTLLVRTMRLLGLVLPARLRNNTMLFVLRHS